MLRFDIEKLVDRRTMNGMHSAIYQSDLKAASTYLNRHGINTHLGGSHVAILDNTGYRIAIITEER